MAHASVVEIRCLRGDNADSGKKDRAYNFGQRRPRSTRERHTGGLTPPLSFVGMVKLARPVTVPQGYCDSGRPFVLSSGLGWLWGGIAGRSRESRRWKMVKNGVLTQGTRPSREPCRFGTCTKRYNMRLHDGDSAPNDRGLDHACYSYSVKIWKELANGVCLVLLHIRSILVK